MNDLLQLTLTPDEALVLLGVINDGGKIAVERHSYSRAWPGARLHRKGSVESLFVKLDTLRTLTRAAVEP
jgi:hypothetical protein